MYKSVLTLCTCAGECIVRGRISSAESTLINNVLLLLYVWVEFWWAFGDCVCFFKDGVIILEIHIVY